MFDRAAYMMNTFAYSRYELFMDFTLQINLIKVIDDIPWYVPNL